jgi:hypothetical protein
MTRKQGNVLAAVLLGLGLLCAVGPLVPALPWGLFRLKDYPPLHYPGGVTFYPDPDGRLPRAGWSADDWDRPGPCPLTVHLPAGDLDPALLGSPDGLRRVGWAAEEVGLGVDVSSPGRVVTCHFRNRALTAVRVDGRAAAERGTGPAAVSVQGRRVELPATAESVAGALGPPPPRR